MCDNSRTDIRGDPEFGPLAFRFCFACARPSPESRSLGVKALRFDVKTCTGHTWLAISPHGTLLRTVGRKSDVVCEPFGRNTCLADAPEAQDGVRGRTFCVPFDRKAPHFAYRLSEMRPGQASRRLNAYRSSEMRTFLCTVRQKMRPRAAWIN